MTPIGLGCTLGGGVGGYIPGLEVTGVPNAVMVGGQNK